MAEERTPYQIIADLVAERGPRSDSEILAELAALPALVDEGNPQWDREDYWHEIAYRYIALAHSAAGRRLVEAIPLLLDRACFGDPGEIMRDLRHSLEAIVNPNWSLLVDLCIAAAGSPRSGTRLWAINQLAILDDPRARPVFERAVAQEPTEIAARAWAGLGRLSRSE